MRIILITMIFLLTIAWNIDAAEKNYSWNFDHEKTGGVPAGFYRAAGSWKVWSDATAPSVPHVLAQLAKNSRETFNMALVAESNYRNLDISVRMRAIGGKSDQGGGIVWRAIDSKNCYVVSFNPLDGNFRFSKIVKNGLVDLAKVHVMNIHGWHTIRVVAVDDHMEGYLDGTKYIDRKDGTYRNGGQIGLWTRGDAQTYFDDLTLKLSDDVQSKPNASR